MGSLIVGTMVGVAAAVACILLQGSILMALGAYGAGIAFGTLSAAATSKIFQKLPHAEQDQALDWG